MAPALRPVAEVVVRRAELHPGETVLDAGTGTGNALGLAGGGGRRLIGADAAVGMLAIARGRAPDAELLEADFARLPLADATVDVVLAVHSLLFAEDRVAALREWLRVAKRGGRLSLSVPGPGAMVPAAALGTVYTRYGLEWGQDDYPTADDVATWASRAGWDAVSTDTDPQTSIPLRDESHFRAWLRVGARGRATGDWTAERREQLAVDLMAAAPRGEDGAFRLPFGTIYLVARRG